MTRRSPTHRRILPGLLILTALGCEGDSNRAPVEITVPDGASFSQVVDTLAARDLVGSPFLFSLYARARGDDREIRSGRYRFVDALSWSGMLDVLTEGRVLTLPMTIPEGWTLGQMVPRIAAISGVPEDSVELLLAGDSAAARYGVPGPSLEGYLFPDTYRFAQGAAPERIIETMAAAYRAYWTPARLARAEALGLTEREATTLASIIQAEAGNIEEMPRISAVYHNRLQEGWRLEADPTVLYALGGPRDRLLFSAIDSVADNPYNTYRQPGLPPGPIGAPGRAALNAALDPEDVPFMFFVAGPDGGHVFSTTLAEHNRAVAEYRRRRAATGDDVGRD